MNYRKSPLSEQTAAAAAFFSQNFVEAEKLRQQPILERPEWGWGFVWRGDLPVRSWLVAIRRG